jgi:hypothetical protein
MENKYIFPAVIKYDENEKVYYINFPDFDNAFTFADDIDEINTSAKEVLELVLYDLEEKGEDIPKATNLNELKNKNIILVEIWMPLVRDKFSNKAVKKTLTVPKWLNDAAIENGVNFSQVLQAALKEYLGISN